MSNWQKSRYNFLKSGRTTNLLAENSEQRTYELDILRNIRNSFGAGSRSNMSTASLARRILLGNKYRNLRASDLEIPEEFSKLKHH